MKKNNRILKYFEIHIAPVIHIFVDMTFLLIAFIFTIEQKENFSKVYKILIIVWVSMFIVKVLTYIYSLIKKSEYQKSLMIEELASAMLRIRQQSDSYKSRHILQITYGSVSKWRPFNYINNVLVYDVHEQIRTILMEFKKAIISITPDLESDALTVDLVYCYLDDYDGSLPATENNVKKWRMINSPDNSSLNCSVYDLLTNSKSFFNYLSEKNYVFLNDKFSIGDDCYVSTGKDHEYGKVGSIAGVVLNIKNDMPQKFLIKAMLTVSTYGTRLYDNSSPIKEEDYEELFKKYIMNGCKSIIESELSQMYIRHMIRDGKMCPYSGEAIKQINHQNKPTTKICLKNIK